MSMDYEKAYKEALERAKMILCNLGEGDGSIRDIETIFPELAESEDERIRKAMLNSLKEAEDSIVLTPFKKKSWIAYLEKQKEQPAEWSEEDEEILNELLDHCNTRNATWYNWLKSLRPQPHWKPSEEQMDWLGTVLRLSKNKPHIHEVIESLYNDLKKLM